MSSITIRLTDLILILQRRLEYLNGILFRVGISLFFCIKVCSLSDGNPKRTEVAENGYSSSGASLAGACRPIRFDWPRGGFRQSHRGHSRQENPRQDRSQRWLRDDLLW